MSEPFDELVQALATDESVEGPGKGAAFGARALKTGGRMFALRAPGGVVLKLPSARVEAIIRQGRGTAWDAGRGRSMKEWVVVKGQRRAIVALAREARDHVAASRRARR